jgi:hypothetical protein
MYLVGCLFGSPRLTRVELSMRIMYEWGRGNIVASGSRWSKRIHVAMNREMYEYEMKMK